MCDEAGWAKRGVFSLFFLSGGWVGWKGCVCVFVCVCVEAIWRCGCRRGSAPRLCHGSPVTVRVPVAVYTALQRRAFIHQPQTPQRARNVGAPLHATVIFHSSPKLFFSAKKRKKKKGELGFYCKYPSGVLSAVPALRAALQPLVRVGHAALLRTLVLYVSQNPPLFFVDAKERGGNKKG